MQLSIGDKVKVTYSDGDQKVGLVYQFEPYDDVDSMPYKVKVAGLRIPLYATPDGRCIGLDDKVIATCEVLGESDE